MTETPEVLTDEEMEYVRKDIAVAPRDGREARLLATIDAERTKSRELEAELQARESSSAQATAVYFKNKVEELEASTSAMRRALEAQLAECYRLSGADPDGNEDWRLAPQAVEEVRRLRQESDEADQSLLDELRVAREVVEAARWVRSALARYEKVAKR